MEKIQLQKIRFNPDIFKNNAEPKRILNTFRNPEFRLSEQDFSKTMTVLIKIQRDVMVKGGGLYLYG